MVLNIRHSFVSVRTDEPPTGRVKPSDWNAPHVITGTLESSNVTGNWPVTQLDSGINAGNATFWRGDGTWQIPSGTVVGDILSLPTRSPLTGSEVTILQTPGNFWKKDLFNLFTEMAVLTNSFLGGIYSFTDNPVPGDAGGDSFHAAFFQDLRLNAPVSLSVGFTSFMGHYIPLQLKNADASYSGGGAIPGSVGTNAKTTTAAAWYEMTAYGGGQRIVHIDKLHAYGMGDAAFNSTLGDFGNGPLPGDEGIGFTVLNSYIQHSDNNPGAIAAPTRALGNTTTTQAINATGFLGTQEIGVVDSTNINVNEWYVIEQMLPSSFYNAEAVKIVAVNASGPNTITANFRNDHNAGVTVTPALVINNFRSRAGQLRVLVNTSGATSDVGTITGTFGNGAMTGAGTAFAVNMVGGSATNIGAISLDRDTYTPTGMRSWYEINGVAAAGQLNIVSQSVANDQSYKSTRGSFPSNFRIRPAVRILYLDFDGSRMICESTDTVWSAGDIVELAVCPYPDCLGFSYKFDVFTPGGTLRSLFSLNTASPSPFQFGLGIEGAFGAGTDLGYSISTGIGITGTNIAIAIGNNASSNAIVINTTVGNGGINWPNDVGNLRLDATHSGFLMSWTGNSLESFSATSAPDPDGQGLGELLLTNSFLKLNSTVSGGNARPHINLMDVQLQASSTTFPLAIEQQAGGGAYGFNIHGSDTGATSRYSGFHSWGMGTNGVLQTSMFDVTLANGANGQVTVTTPASFIRIIGPTAPFSIGGFIFGSWGVGNLAAGDGTELHLYNSTAFAMTIVNNVGGTIDARFLTLTGADVTLRAGTSAAIFKYSAADQRWILLATN